MPTLWLIEAQNGSVNYVIIGSDNGLTPAWHRAINCTNTDMSWNKLRGNLTQNRAIFLQENAFENTSAKWWLLCLGLNMLSVQIPHVYPPSQPSHHCPSNGARPPVGTLLIRKLEMFRPSLEFSCQWFLITVVGRMMFFKMSDDC